ncbi:threonine-phosphate decarboxylase [Sporanaerobium hydrogeniformans]|uniref:Threonine-phosphate decarboxylase n=1 Tax=Sporanaerobium hydrogeniformans TaxID=3072179 RepID=A0AC61DCE6_9FIRM|nr:threonine-phosphate decarboxylase CobD [Sporanaerobium hydrogeniformans]PHV70994.1 threonine-phosphate decarboxylase [Sporanaerobium hydrogeniformans]
MKHLGHGADGMQMARRYGKDPTALLDFSANINPYLPEKLEEAVLEGLKQSRHYPDSCYSELREQLAQYCQVEPTQVIPGNGATEVIYLLMKSLKGRLGILNPTFSEYERSARLSGLEVYDLYWDKEADFAFNLEEIKAHLEDFDFLFLCNPNNPTGRVEDLQALLSLLEERGKLLIVDETFMEFVEEEERVSLVKKIATSKQLIIIKAATKFFGMPGLRLGYALTSNKALMERMYSYKEPWSINSFAEAIAKVIFQQKAYQARSKAYYQVERRRILGQLSQIQGLKVYPTATNFILLRIQEETAACFKEKLLVKHNLLIRDASNFKGLDPHFIRVAIKTPEENDILVRFLKEELEGSTHL